MPAPVLVFQNNDGPSPCVPTHFDETTLTLRVVAPGCTRSPVWQGVRLPADSPAAMLAKAAAASDAGVKVSKKLDVVSLIRLNPVGVSQTTLNAPDDVVAGLDFRTAAGKKMDNQRREYGATYANAPAKPQAVNAEEMYKKKAEKIKRVRSKVNEEIDASAAAPDTDDTAAPPVADHRTESKPAPKRAPRATKSS